MNSSMAVTIESVRMALDATSVRQRLIANNIANVNTPGHVRMKVVFEDQLAQALQGISGDDNEGEAMSRLSDVRTDILPASPTGTPVQLDREMVDLSSNTMRYHALSKALTKYFQLASAISSPGR